MSKGIDDERRGRKPAKMSIGEKLKALRKAAGYTGYTAFANAHGIQPKQYWRLEEDQTDFKFSSLRRIIDIHNLSLEEFFKGVG